MKITDRYGARQDLDWLRHQYGQVEWTNTTNHELVELYEVDGPTTQVITILRKDGTGLPYTTVRFSWEDGAKWDEGFTNQEGNAGFGMGEGAFYELPNQGPHQVSYEGASVRGLGWMWMSNHRHLNVVFQEITNEPPPPEPDIWAKRFMELITKLDTIIRKLEMIEYNTR